MLAALGLGMTTFRCVLIIELRLLYYLGVENNATNTTAPNMYTPVQSTATHGTIKMKIGTVVDLEQQVHIPSLIYQKA